MLWVLALRGRDCLAHLLSQVEMVPPETPAGGSCFLLPVSCSQLGTAKNCQPLDFLQTRLVFLSLSQGSKEPQS